MRILLLTHAFNALAQACFVALREAGHEVTVELDINDTVTAEAVDLAAPELVIAPFLKRAIPEHVWRRVPCFIVHPGIRGDRGPSALDWAILEEANHWGVTVLQAEAELDAGPVWGWREFPMRRASKSSHYRHEVTAAAVAAVLEAVARFAAGAAPPAPSAECAGRWRPAMRQADRAIDWSRDPTASVLRKIASADGMPGVRGDIAGHTVYLHDAWPAPGLSGPPGDVLARSGPAVAVATVDGAVWIGRLREPASTTPFKLPATRVLSRAIADLPEIARDTSGGYREIAYEERGAVGYLHFAFYNGAMGTEACQRLLTAYRAACARPTRVIVLMGGPEFWSNGLDLNLIEAADSAADESWRNINAIDDLSEAVVRTTSHLTVSVLRGNAGAGGVFLARAADAVWARPSIILNPHYKDMGNLYGSELWTYLLPRHAGPAAARGITEARLPMGVREACRLGLVDDILPEATPGGACVAEDIATRAAALAAAPEFTARLAAKTATRQADEATKPLSTYRAEELARMHLNFYGFDPSYHVARSNFVRKVVKSRTPVSIARHRDRRLVAAWRRAS